ncbi:SH3 domain-containing protein 21 isoform X2 [Betta splendens]|uniref:Osteoclast-stimulating factor 1 n=1 Tax=Betta splendens TaxID=158456 RepID=A0A6P7KPM8_BETSP|nr:SH3 domain-containing protein 21 isoform X2 [Betta splendens]
MEVLVLVDFEGTMADELIVKAGDVVQNVTKASEEGWLQGEIRGKRGLVPASFVKEVPSELTGGTMREPRSLRKPKATKQPRKCQVEYAYSPMNADEMELVVGETIEILKEIEDGWWMGMKNGKVGAFPSNFVKEIVVNKENKPNDVKGRSKLSNVVFNKELSHKASVRNKQKNVVEYCHAMFDYKAKTEDELDLKKGDVVVILKKETEDEGWWEGELNGRCGFFPDNFVMVIPPTDSLQFGTTTQLPARSNSKKLSDDKTDGRDMRSIPPTKVKLPCIIKPSPPPVKDKPNRGIAKTNGDVPPSSPKPTEEKEEKDQFDGLDVQTEKLSHPTANRAKPPQRRPPSGLVTGVHFAEDHTEAEKKPQTTKLSGLQKGTENLALSPAKSESQAKTPPPVRPTPPKVAVDGKAATSNNEPTMESLQAEIKELRMALELLQTRHEQDMQEVKAELREEKDKRLTLQDEVSCLKMKH